MDFADLVVLYIDKAVEVWYNLGVDVTGVTQGTAREHSFMILSYAWAGFSRFLSWGSPFILCFGRQTGHIG